MAARKKRRGGVRPGAGRKPKPAAEKQRRGVTASLTDAEYAELERVARGQPLGTVARVALLRFLAGRRRK